MGPEIRVVAVGDVDIRAQGHLSIAVAETFGRKRRIANPLPAPGYAFDPRRGQHSAEAILQRLPVNALLDTDFKGDEFCPRCRGRMQLQGHLQP